MKPGAGCAEVNPALRKVRRATKPRTPPAISRGELSTQCALAHQEYITPVALAPGAHSPALAIDRPMSRGDAAFSHTSLDAKAENVVRHAFVSGVNQVAPYTERHCR